MFGFLAALYITQQAWSRAAQCILLAAFMDAIDGRTARLVGVTSEFGVQLDSLADVLSFCFIPAFFVYQWQLKDMGFFGILVAFLFLVAGVVRLARFNIIHAQQTRYFLGLPTTIAGCFIATLVLNVVSYDGNVQLISYGSVVILLILSGLMVSSVPFPTFKQRVFRKRKNWLVLGIILFFAVIAVMRISSALLALFLLYFVYSIVWVFFYQGKKRFLQPEDGIK